MRINFTSWNLNWVSRTAESNRSKCELLTSQPWDILALQEVTETFVDQFKDRFPDSELLLAPGFALGERRHGAALALRNGWRRVSDRIFEHLPKPGRGVGALLERDGFKLAAASWHAPNASGDGRETKMDGYRSMWSWIAAQDTPVILGLDGNRWERRLGLAETYRRDPSDPWLAEEMFFSDSAGHGLKDMYLDLLRRRPDLQTDLPNATRPGPLATTYVRRNRGAPIRERMDYVFASPCFAPSSVEHDYEAGRTHRSDHAPVQSSLALAS